MRFGILPFALAVAAGAADAQVRGSNSLPAVSPNGEWIAFISERDGTENVFVIHPDGTGQRQVSQGGAHSARWSPDGREIRVVVGGADSGRVFSMFLDGTHRREVASVVGRSPRLSPDGKWAVYLSGPWTSTSLMVAHADGSDARRVAGGRTTAWNGAWSPDGRRLAYTSGDSTRVLQVHLVHPDGTGDSTATHTPAEEGSTQLPEWSPDGGRLAVQVTNGRTHTGHVWIIDLATGEARRLAPHPDGTSDEVPSWFPDGKQIAFQSDRSGRMEIWVMNADGTGLRQVTR